MIHIHPRLGPYAPDIGWYPMPSYLLRRERIRHLLDITSPANILEVGCGPGMLLHDYAQAGHSCTGLELSQKAIEIAKRINTNPSITFHNTPSDHWDGSFDILFAFEVLEHIEDDLSALKSWLPYLKPSGTCIFSVPNHAHKWTYTDTIAGHVRRYDKTDLKNLCERAGLHVEALESYGFPMGNVASFVRNAILEYRANRKSKHPNSPPPATREEMNLQSGIDRNFPLVFRLCQSMLGRLALPVGYKMQQITRNRNWGEGLIIMAKKIE